ncbi:MAG: hypothetical protein JW714_04720 [Candidatus Omnitrophica bacterium]|nr:hypothetical protein [Candidatus Omnitrophota bacterium]
MSIINQALKKAEQEKQTRAHAQNRTTFQKSSAQISLLIICLLAVFLASRSLHNFSNALSLDQRSSASEITQQPQAFPQETAASSRAMRRIEIEQPAGSAILSLSGIIYDQDKPLALINQQVVNTGSLISGARVMEIQPDSVRLSFQGEQFTLQLK